jgi:GTP cyclohydrolase I
MRKPGNPDNTRLEASMFQILREIGEDPKREGLLSTPKRYAKSMRFLTSGYDVNLKEIVGEGVFKAEASDIVLVRDIELYSLCEHHLLPFYGRAHVAYLPRKKILGLSKIPRVVDAYARRLQVQERLTSQIADAICELVNPLGVAVVIEAYHLCMMMRGVGKQNSKTVTSKMHGEFRKNGTTRQELLHLLNGISLSN